MSSKPVLSFVLARGRPLAPQIEEQLREAIRSGILQPGTQLPSTRALATDLGVSRGVIVNAYQELLAQGFLESRRRAVPVVARRVEAPVEHAIEPDVPVAGATYNLRPDLPDLSMFPRARWLAACSEALRNATTSDFAYGDPFGAAQLRVQLASFLWRTRGVGAEPSRLGIHVGSTQALSALCSALRARGVARIGVEDPSHRWRRATIAATGLEVVPIAADANGLNVEVLASTAVDAVVVSPDHNFPYGGTMSDERRAALVRWAVHNDTLVVEHDYDGFFRYDHRARSVLQSQAPERVIYVGTASALVAPSLRIGWTVLPRYLVVDVAEHMAYEVFAHSRIHQLAFAQLIASGQLDRHLRRVRARYAPRHQLARELLPARGAAAGLYLHVPLESSADERALLDDLKHDGVAIDGVRKNAVGDCDPGLVVGFAAAPEPTLREGLQRLRARL
jgi:GntR family transcriptional regulator / MocR family aminotransferase